MAVWDRGVGSEKQGHRLLGKLLVIRVCSCFRGQCASAIIWRDLEVKIYIQIGLAVEIREERETLRRARRVTS